MPARNRLKNGAWLSLARALALGARGHRFKSCRPDKLKYSQSTVSRQANRVLGRDPAGRTNMMQWDKSVRPDLSTIIFYLASTLCFCLAKYSVGVRNPCECNEQGSDIFFLKSTNRYFAVKQST